LLKILPNDILNYTRQGYMFQLVVISFSWDYTHVLHDVNSYHKRVFVESLYII